ncbi:bifunctional diaminohydroxyphosphoribosylaminopyrimidine deaminase/5-amino-6-(5-phosphoribosylamino)uracil reductase RibD [Francisella adeliensis]|uniref:Riboflavin biosynthesis protein RibD n=1 Tax=Francisella adeliensis TaxID=2007306 RepID=A0A2Z4XX63_9GAMM|nr:bifunctional diaminohydroxyphosphoribosylaminopyrimidine deaminase/5-amino-6-(5-phosphoribosylamino)uracil reductase RibD [Francisella adeliensis]AXA33188.1 riboflavin biosynthesis protein RibD [Francisella adeliensis]MBK2085093.1 bifunctional diaminohydroxyphosphoribosylaminopyrimidine deaminase/5-amino-6-(5-phosphoribosylamino)uracil reductase RibD [Francisella adeliensis]MBK2096916.1 bifunctional diaminohydroxyphosphoribosylaminopyrimidine deaminase/5-amino-6-(5-phosphoribosylamino)uracil 
MKHIDQYYMQQALTLANRGRFSVSPNPMVGCIIVKDGLIVGEGYHAQAGKAHAEKYALEKSGSNAQGATVYVTLEPCCHFGKTPPCTKALIEAKVSRVVVATLDPNPKMAGKGIDILLDSGIEAEVGLLEDKAQDLNKIFFHYQKHKKPFVFAKWAMSLDGKIKVNSYDSKKISSKEVFINTHQTRNICDAILVGKNTLIDDNPELDVRINLNRKINPTRIVVFNEIEDISESWKVLDQRAAKTILVCTSIDQGAKEKLDNLGVECWIVPTRDNNLNLDSLLHRLGGIGITSILVEGGQKILESFITQELINEFIVSVSPVAIAKTNPKKKLKFNNTRLLSNDLLINASFAGDKNV